MSEEPNAIEPDTIGQGIEPIGFVEGGRSDRRDDGWDREFATIALTDRFGAESFTGLDAFSHVEVVFRFHGLSDDEVTTDARHPSGQHRLAARGHLRPAGQQATEPPRRHRLSVVGVGERSVQVQGLDAIEGTPILDIEPVMRAFLPRGEIVEPSGSAS